MEVRRLESLKVGKFEGWEVGRLEGWKVQGVLSFPQVIISDQAERRRRQARRDKCTRDECTVVSQILMVRLAKSALSGLWKWCYFSHF